MNQPSDERQAMPFRGQPTWRRLIDRPALQLLALLLASVVSLSQGQPQLAVPLALVTIAVALLRMAPDFWQRLTSQLDEQLTTRTMALLALAGGLLVFTAALGLWEPLLSVYRSGNWEAIGALGEGVIGAFGQHPFQGPVIEHALPVADQL